MGGKIFERWATPKETILRKNRENEREEGMQNKEWRDRGESERGGTQAQGEGWIRVPES